MAWTAIKALNFRLDVSVNYVLDKEKTVLYSAIGYALNSDKTEQSCFETAHLCRLRHAYEDMTDTKRRYGKTDGIQGYHMVQSFAQGEVTPEQAHAIGVEFAKRLLGNEYEAVISTHLNTNHYHNHIVFNSVSLTTGKKYRSNAKTYYTQIRKLSDDICREHGLSIIEPSEPEYHYYTIENKPCPAIKLKGLRALYFHYLYLIGALPKNHGHKMTREEYLILRNDIGELDKRIAMNGYLIRNNIATLPELHKQRDAVSAKLRELTLARKRYYNNDPDSERIQERTIRSNRCGKRYAFATILKRTAFKYGNGCGRCGS